MGFRVYGEIYKMIYISQEVRRYSYGDEANYDELLGYLTRQLTKLKLKNGSAEIINEGDTETRVHMEEEPTQESKVQDPPRVWTKGCGASIIIPSGSTHKVQFCSICGGHGHNWRCCTSDKNKQPFTVDDNGLLPTFPHHDVL